MVVVLSDVVILLGLRLDFPDGLSAALQLRFLESPDRTEHSFANFLEISEGKVLVLLAPYTRATETCLQSKNKGNLQRMEHTDTRRVSLTCRHRKGAPLVVEVVQLARHQVRKELRTPNPFPHRLESR